MSVTRRRFNAAVLDNIVLIVPAVGTQFYDWGVAVFGVALFLVYFHLCEATSGQTVGKAVFKVRVVTLDGSIGGGRAIAARTLLRLFPFALFDLVFVWCNPARRRIGDYAAGTVVVDALHPVETRPLTLGLLGYPVAWLTPALVICVLSAQGSFPGSYRYEVDALCEQVDAHAERMRDPMQLAVLARREAMALAAIEAPLNWRDRHDALVNEYRNFSQRFELSLQRALDSPNSDATWQRERSRLVRYTRRANRRLRALGYRGCAGETTAA